MVCVLNLYFHLVYAVLYFVFGVPNLAGQSQPLKACLIKISKFDNDSPVENCILGVILKNSIPDKWVKIEFLQFATKILQLQQRG